MQWSDYSALSISRACYFVNAGLWGFSDATMTNLDAAYEILKQAGQPLRYEQIAEQAPVQRLTAPHELRPRRRYVGAAPTS